MSQVWKDEAEFSVPSSTSRILFVLVQMVLKSFYLLHFHTKNFIYRGFYLEEKRLLIK